MFRSSISEDAGTNIRCALCHFLASPDLVSILASDWMEHTQNSGFGAVAAFRVQVLGAGVQDSAV